MVICSIIGCRHRRGRNKGVSFFRFPAVITHQGRQTEELSRRRRALWLTCIAREDLYARDTVRPDGLIHMRVCSAHFVRGRPSALYDRTNPDWAPTVNLGHNNPEVLNMIHNQLKDEARMAMMRQVSQVAVGMSSSGIAPSGISTGQMMVPRPPLSQNDIPVVKPCQSSFVPIDPRGFQLIPIGVDKVPIMAPRKASKRKQDDLPTMTIKSCQTEETMIHRMQMEQDVIILRSEVYQLRQEIADIKMQETAFQNNNNKVRFYTGLPNYQLFVAFLNFVAPHVARSYKNTLSRFQEFLLVMMRLRLNVSLADLGYRFGISAATTSRIFDKWIEAMDVRFKHLLVWPERARFNDPVPPTFMSTVGDGVCMVVHYFELNLDWPRSWVLRSNRKKRHTFAFLIGIAPCGVISFASKVWIGKDAPALQEDAVEKSGLLKKLEIGDLVVAVTDFDLGKTGLYCGRVTPSETDDRKKSLSSSLLSYEESGLMNSFVRLLIEKVARGLRQQFQIMGDPVPNQLLAHHDNMDMSVSKVVRVCCSLCNTLATVGGTSE